MSQTILYDARPLQPGTRQWGPGVVLNQLLMRLSSNFHFTGMAQDFADAKDLKISTWKELPKLHNLLFEISPLLASSFDIYWGTNHFLPQLSLGKPTVITVHDLLLLRYPNDQRQSRYYSWRLVSSLRRADRVVAISETTAQDLLVDFPWLKNKLRVALNGYDSTPVTEQDVGIMRERFPEPYVVMLGGHRPRKNLSLGIASVAILRDMGVPIRLIISGNIHTSFQPLLNIHADILEQTGMLSRGQLRALLKNSQAMLFPSIYEGFGLPLLEAMSQGCPILALDIPINREIANQAALLLPDDPAEWAKQLKNVLHDSILRTELIESGFANLKRFDWNYTANVYTQIFHEVMT